jgi:hypothetical protein
MKRLKLVGWLFLFSFQHSYSQNVGIGLSNPTRAKLEVNGAVGATAAIFGGEGHGISLQRDFSGIGFNQYYNGSSKYIGNGFAAVQWLHQGTGWMAFDMFPTGLANATPASVTRGMTLTPQGHLAIGGATPNGDLQFMNTLNNRKIVLWESANNDHQYYGFGIEGGTLRYAVDAPGAAHRFYSGNNSSSSSLLMTIAGNKKVIIGTQAGGSRVGVNSGDPQISLEVVQTAQTGLALIEPLANYNNWEIKAWNTPLPNPVALNFLYNGVNKSYIYYVDGSFNTWSDTRIKNDQQKMAPILSKVLQLNPMTYQYKLNNPENETSLGFLAQEVKPLFPELVHVAKGKVPGYDNISDLHSINYSGFGIIAIKAIQEQQQIIQDQQKQIDGLIKRLDAVEMKRQ